MRNREPVHAARNAWLSPSRLWRRNDRLRCHKLVVRATPADQIPVAALLDNPAIGDDDNAVIGGKERNPVGDHDNGALPGYLMQLPVDFLSGEAVQRTGCLVDDENRAAGEE